MGEELPGTIYDTAHSASAINTYLWVVNDSTSPRITLTASLDVMRKVARHKQESTKDAKSLIAGQALG